MVERAGIINISLEGVILSGAFGALVGATRLGVAGGYAMSVGFGVLMSIVFAVFVVFFEADQVITGTAVTLLAVGATGTLYRALYGATGAALSLPTTGPYALPGLASIPGLGSGFFNQPVVTYVWYLAVPAIWWWLYRTQAGLALRAVGESPRAAEAAEKRSTEAGSVFCYRVWRRVRRSGRRFARARAGGNVR